MTVGTYTVRRVITETIRVEAADDEQALTKARWAFDNAAVVESVTETTEIVDAVDNQPEGERCA